MIRDILKSRLFNTLNKNNFHLEQHKSYLMTKRLRVKMLNLLMEIHPLHLLLKIGIKKKHKNYLNRKNQLPNKFNKLKI